jgi:peptidyl-prolyl cis-trans isomerase SurA
MRRIAFAVVLSLAAPATATAQDPDPVSVDTLYNIVAVAGDSAISQAELARMVELWETTEGQQRPPGGPALDSLVLGLLNDRIDALLIIQAAQQDTSIRVTDDEVRTAVDNQVARAQAEFPSRAQFEVALAQSNLTLQDYRNLLTTQIRQQRLMQIFMNKQERERSMPRVSDERIRDTFDRQVELAGGAPPTLPPSLTFDQVVVPVVPSDTALARAKAKADSLVVMIREEGQPFEAVARRYSEDPGSAELGGDLGWFRPGVMTLDFERAVYSPLLRPGDVTNPVLTPFGYHIIKLERVRTAERNARHILIRPSITPDDVERARQLAERIAEQLRSGVSLDSLRRVHGDADSPARLGPLVRDSMPAEYRAATANVVEGDIVGPFTFSDAIQKWAVLRIEVVEPERRATVEDYREQLQQQLARDLLYDEVIAELRDQTFVEIRSFVPPIRS